MNNLEPNNPYLDEQQIHSSNQELERSSHLIHSHNAAYHHQQQQQHQYQQQYGQEHQQYQNGNGYEYQGAIPNASGNAVYQSAASQYDARENVGLNRDAPPFVPKEEEMDENDKLAMEEGFVVGDACDHVYDEMDEMAMEMNVNYNYNFDIDYDDYYQYQHQQHQRQQQEQHQWHQRQHQHQQYQQHPHQSHHSPNGSRSRGHHSHNQSHHHNHRNGNQHNSRHNSIDNEKNLRYDWGKRSKDSKLGTLGVPFEHDASQGEPKPLTKADCLALKSKQVLWIVDPSGLYWTYNKFDSVDTQKNLLIVCDNIGHKTRHKMNRLPTMLMQPVRESESKTNQTETAPTASADATADGTGTANGDKTTPNNKTTALRDAVYSKILGRMITLNTDDLGFATFQVLAYNQKTSFCELLGGDGMRRKLRLDQFEHEILEVSSDNKFIKPGSKKLEIKEKTEIEETREPPMSPTTEAAFAELALEPVTERKERTQSDNPHNLPSVNCEDLIDLWDHGELDSILTTHMDWGCYKNSFLKCLSVGSDDTQYTNLDYNNLMVVSGIGLSFFWPDFVDTNEILNNDWIEEHSKLLMCDSQFGDILERVSKHSGYILTMLSCKPALQPETLESNESIHRMESIIIDGLKHKIATITHDNMGHCALIVGYCEKPEKYRSSNNDDTSNTDKTGQKLLETKYFFKIKKMVSVQQHQGYFDTMKMQRQDKKHVNAFEYETVDLSKQTFIIILQYPQVNQPSHLIDRMKIGMIRDSLQAFSKQYKTGSNIFCTNTDVGDANDAVTETGDLTGAPAINTILEEIDISIENELLEEEAPIGVAAGTPPAPGTAVAPAEGTQGAAGTVTGTVTGTIGVVSVSDELDKEVLRNDQLFGRMVIYALIRFYDSRDAIHNFFDKMYTMDKQIDEVKGGLRSQLYDIKVGIKRELTLCRKEGGDLFTHYVENYNGNRLPEQMKEWTVDNKRQIKTLLTNILTCEEEMFEICDKIADLLTKHIEKNKLQ